MPKLLTKSDVYSEFPYYLPALEGIANVKGKKKLKDKTRQIIFAVEDNNFLRFIKGTSCGYGTNKLCEVHVEVHSSLEFLKELPEFDTVSFSCHYYIFNIHKKFLLRAK